MIRTTPLKGRFSYALSILATHKRVNELLHAHLVCNLIFVKLVFDVFCKLLFVTPYDRILFSMWI